MTPEQLELFKTLPPAAWVCSGVALFAFWAVFWGMFVLIFQKNLAAIPAEHRRITPWQIWLLAVLPVSLVWTFFVFPRISASWQSWLRSRGVAAGACGRKTGLWCAILGLLANVVTLLPLFGGGPAFGTLCFILSIVATLAGLIFLIAFCVIINDLRLRHASGDEISEQDSEP